MIRWVYGACASLSLLLVAALAVSQPVSALPDTLPPAVEDVLDSGVLIVISKPSQRMYVFKDGQPWRDSAVSTGKRGHTTPSGVFPILQKAVRHRSNLYSNAPMPFMQRLTWGGIAIHAGDLPGYPASHGCIRLPMEMARALFALTRAEATTIVISDTPIATFAHAGALALGSDTPLPGKVAPQLASVSRAQTAPKIAILPVIATAPQPRSGPSQTIQLAAAITPAEADAHWAELLSLRPELSRFEKAVVPAVVGSRRFYRLRASAPGAFAVCSSLKQAGHDCFNVS